MKHRINIAPLSIIVAVDECAGFGKDGKIPWYFSEDLKHFQNTTKNSVCIMGRHTYTDMLNMRLKKVKKKQNLKELLPGRECYVITSKPKLDLVGGAKAAKSITAAVQQLPQEDNREVFILGGYRMFVEALPWTSTIYMTIVKGKCHDCDRFFPVHTLNHQFKITDGKETDNLYFITYKRK